MASPLVSTFLISLPADRSIARSEADKEYELARLTTSRVVDDTCDSRCCPSPNRAKVATLKCKQFECKGRASQPAIFFLYLSADKGVGRLCVGGCVLLCQVRAIARTSGANRGASCPSLGLEDHDFVRS